MSLVTDEIRAKATEVYNGDEICQAKSKELLAEIELPNGLLPLHDIEECGIDRETGFVWLKQKQSITHEFKEIGRLVTYGPEVTAVVEKGKIKKLTGVKTRELLIWVSLCDIYTDEPPTGILHFKSPTGLYRTFPASVFVVEVKDETAAAAKEAAAKEETTAAAAPAEAVEVKEA
ncbi:unnamed protein product [Linum tenue]|uniref:Uncharacterized protein n=1 Tax=Linum tenue TaxID=586396 RepID=A0AAV0NMK6_9ROSI|nr:unnamed protein product [Linum tenue]